VYEQFFQRFSPDVADTYGIVYALREIVDYMCNSGEAALKEGFGYSLASPEAVILDPMHEDLEFHRDLDRAGAGALAEAYQHRLFANAATLG
jgi:predicted helicase